MATKPILPDIGNDPVTGANITKEPLNEALGLVNNFADSIQSERITADGNLQTQINTNNTRVTNHVNGDTEKHEASDVTFTPTGAITAVNTQSAVAQVDARVSNIIAQSGTSDTEVVDARLSSEFDYLDITNNPFPSLKDRLDNTDVLVNDLYTPESTPFTTSASIDSLPIGTLEGKASGFSAEGLTLVNSVENGDFSDGTTGWTATSSTQSAANNIYTNTGNGAGSVPFSSRGSSVYIKTGEKYFMRIKARVTNTVSTSIAIRVTSSGVIVTQIASPIQNQWYDIYAIYTVGSGQNGLELITRASHSYADAATANGKVMEVDGNAGVHAINLTTLGLEALTEAQLLDLVRSGYIDGIQGVVNPTIEIKNVGETETSQLTANTTLHRLPNGIFDRLFEGN